MLYKLVSRWYFCNSKNRIFAAGKTNKTFNEVAANISSGDTGIKTIVLQITRYRVGLFNLPKKFFFSVFVACFLKMVPLSEFSPADA